ncbi:MAG TPA: hypothetical protein VK457_12605 [Chloroflexota bacterium]|nr:hypothetical protein [Chloroflexota bacterium]
MRLLAAALVLLLAGCGGGSAPPTAHTRGTILAVDGQTLLVDKNLVVLPPSVPLDPSARAGARVTVSGSWGPAGQLIASNLQVDAAAPSPTVAPSPTPARQPVQPPARGKEKGGKD